jgi:putative ABC transport system permease protein
VIGEVMHFSFVFEPVTAIAAALVAVLLTIGFGLIGTFRALGEEPVKVLRSL